MNRKMSHRHCVTWAPLKRDVYDHERCRTYEESVDYDAIEVVDPSDDGAWQLVSSAATDRAIFWTWQRLDLYVAANSGPAPKQLLRETPAPALLH